MDVPVDELYRILEELGARFEKDKAWREQNRRQAKKSLVTQLRNNRTPKADKNFELVTHVEATRIQRYWDFITNKTDIHQRAVNAVEFTFSRYEFEFVASNKMNTLKKLLDDPSFKTVIRQFLVEITVDLFLFAFTVVRFPLDTVDWLEDGVMDNLIKQNRADKTDSYQRDILNEATMPRDLIANTALSLPFGRVPIYAGDYYHHVNKNTAQNVYTFFPRLPEAQVLREKFRTVVFVRPSARPQRYDISTGLQLCYHQWVLLRTEITKYIGASTHVQRPLVLMEERMTKSDSQVNLAAEIAPYLASIITQPPGGKDSPAGKNRQALQIRHRLASVDAATVMRGFLIDSHLRVPQDGSGRPVNGAVTAIVEGTQRPVMRKTRPDAMTEVSPVVLDRREYDANDVGLTQADEYGKWMASAPIGFDISSYHAPQPQEGAVRMFQELYERELRRLFSGLDLDAGTPDNRDLRVASDRTGIKNLRLVKIQEQQRDLRILRLAKEYFGQIYAESGAEIDQIDLMETMGKIRDLLDAAKLVEAARSYISEEIASKEVTAEEVLSNLLELKARRSEGKAAASSATTGGKKTQTSLIDMTVSYYNKFSLIRRNIALFQRILFTLQRAILMPGNRLELVAKPTEAEQDLLAELSDLDGADGTSGGKKAGGGKPNESIDTEKMLNEFTKALGEVDDSGKKAIASALVNVFGGKKPAPTSVI